MKCSVLRSTLYNIVMVNKIVTESSIYSFFCHTFDTKSMRNYWTTKKDYYRHVWWNIHNIRDWIYFGLIMKLCFRDSWELQPQSNKKNVSSSLMTLSKINNNNTSSKIHWETPDCCKSLMCLNNNPIISCICSVSQTRHNIKTRSR